LKKIETLKKLILWYWRLWTLNWNQCWNFCNVVDIELKFIVYFSVIENIQSKFKSMTVQTPNTFVWKSKFWTFLLMIFYFVVYAGHKNSDQYTYISIQSIYYSIYLSWRPICWSPFVTILRNLWKNFFSNLEANIFIFYQYQMHGNGIRKSSIVW